MIMKIAVGTDHGGLILKQAVIEEVQRLGHEVLDFGTDSPASVDYPDFAAAVGNAVVSGQAERGIAICGSGVGVTVAANKIKGVRACLCHDTYSAHQGVEHDDLNVLCLGGRVIGPALAGEIVQAFLSATFHNEARFTRRLDKVIALENQ
ncbi:sugar-phosphate isomerase, RpiB/LacA/LacB family [Herpetosiphon aurantiacus DSM 785]|uniref:Sugar-phosphate isomerase, RpiB/LacA/LacB family n=2 Tax=Herpetosiphon TaxID=64 RepID=A9AV61_HERA2|nr:ribose 5-phosphate isomerase B [Herpetosiphon sp.]ABX03139.1 sugar-phosphate isomerase, RpiB/LacA/LacB family [Herpetosiphon aurantiacus DSM 785]